MPHKVEVSFDDFGWQALSDEARRQDVTLEELIVHAAMYYLADTDRERFSRRVMPSRDPADPNVPADEARRQT